MNWWLKGNARKQVAPLAAQEPSGYWDRVGAGYQLSRIEDNSWNRAEVTERAYYADLAEQMSSQVPTLKDRPAPYKLAEWNSLPQVRKRLAVQAQAMVAQNPELRGHFPTTPEELEAGALEYRRKEAQEARRRAGAPALGGGSVPAGVDWQSADHPGENPPPGPADRTPADRDNRRQSGGGRRQSRAPAATGARPVRGRPAGAAIPSPWAATNHGTHI